MKTIHSFFLFSTVLLFCFTPTEQQMIVKRQSGIAEISNYDEPFLSRRETVSPVQDNCGRSEGSGQQQESSPYHRQEGNNGNYPVQEKPVQGNPVTGGANSTSHGGKVNVVVPSTLSFDTMFAGDATYYGSAGGGGACGFGSMKTSLPGIAIGSDIFGSGEACGACVKLYPGSHGKPVIVTVDNKCPECGKGTDLSTEAWKQMTTESPTRFPIKWEFVPCGIKENIEIQSISKGNLYDIRFNFRGNSGALLNVEISSGPGSWMKLQRKNNDSTSYVPAESGKDHEILSQASFAIRLTNAKGDQITCSGLKTSSWDSSSDNWLACPSAGFQFTTT